MDSDGGETSRRQGEGVACLGQGIHSHIYLAAKFNNLTNLISSLALQDTSQAFPALNRLVAKLHAIEALQSEVMSLDIDIAIMAESHIKARHSSGAVGLLGYTCYRRDQWGRRGGGVAIYIREGVPATAVNIDGDLPAYETMWLRILWKDMYLILAGIYHPPKPIYSVNDFTHFVESNVENVCNLYPGDDIFLCGDFNQLDDQTVSLSTGLHSLVSAPTRGLSCLDRVYTSSTKPLAVKVVKSSVKSDHSAVVVTDDLSFVNQLKKT